jgi:serine/threonine protein kinase
MWQSTNTIWAIKMLKKAEVIRLQQVEHMVSEKTILQTLDHPFIVSMGAIFQGAGNEPLLFFECVDLLHAKRGS